MRVVAGALNGTYLREINENSSAKVEWVRAAVAYAAGDEELIEFCMRKAIPITYWGRYDSSVPVPSSILKRFLNKKSPNYVCKLVPDYLHAKVIWWVGYGVYIGSANLTKRAWYDNIEYGVFVDELEMAETGMAAELEDFFRQLDERAIPLTEEVLKEVQQVELQRQTLVEQERKLTSRLDDARRIPMGKPLVRVAPKDRRTQAKVRFLEEWNHTLQILRDIGSRVSEDTNRPSWIESSVPTGVQADQFLHAFYYNRVREGHSYPYRVMYGTNRANPEHALEEAIRWWRGLGAPPTFEDRTINDWAPVVRKSLSRESLKLMTLSEFQDVCERVHAIRNHAARTSNQLLGLAEGTSLSEDERIEKFASYLWGQRSKQGKSVVDLLDHILYGGVQEEVPDRLWEAANDEQWRIPHLGISGLGEMVGWALPELFPPRNGRTSKALVALGYDVTVHSE